MHADSQSRYWTEAKLYRIAVGARIGEALTKFESLTDDPVRYGSERRLSALGDRIGRKGHDAEGTPPASRQLFFRPRQLPIYHRANYIGALARTSRGVYYENRIFSVGRC